MDAWLTDILVLLQDNRAELWEGLVVTLQLWAASGAAGLVLALGLALGATHGGPWRAAAAAFAASPTAVADVVGRIAPDIFGHADVKKAVACLMFGGSRKV